MWRRVVVLLCLLRFCVSADAQTKPSTTQPSTTRPAASISIEIDEGQRWPGNVRVKVTCDAPAEEQAIRKHVQLVDVGESRLKDLRAQVMETDRRWQARAASGDRFEKAMYDQHFPNAMIWIVYTQKTKVKPRQTWMFHIIEPAPEGEILPGQRNALSGSIRRDHYLPGTIEVFAIWTENDLEVARSAPVLVEVRDGSSLPATTRASSAR